MKYRWIYLCLMLFVSGCSSSTSEGSQKSDTNTQENENSEKENTVVEKTCDTMSCPHGCCNDTCVDLRSDAEFCGRCDTQCGSEEYCLDGVCTVECSGDNARICDGVCVDLSTNIDHCGECQHACATGQRCDDGACVCSSGRSDCDGNAENGCESRADLCFCTTGDTVECYPGDESQAGVGRCRMGVQVCEDGYYGVCENYILPTLEIPGNGIDDDCDGENDEAVDEDGDGYYFGYGPGLDCCDNKEVCGVEDPSKVNPGAHEDPSNGIDDDCDGIIDENDDETCSSEAYTFTAGKALSDDDAVRLARAMDICGDATETSGSGLISAQLLQADGSALPASGDKSVCGNATLISPAEQVSVVNVLGAIASGYTVPALTSTMAVLSSGKALGNENTGTRDCAGTESSAPSVFLNGNGGYLPVSASCTKAEADSTMANDSIMLRLRLRAPSNAKGFSFKFKFFSKEYPDYVCGNYNDFFLALIDASSSEIPADHNISFDANHNPVSVNNAFFTECDASTCSDASSCSCTGGSDSVRAYFNTVTDAGATSWLQTSAPVTGGEVFTLDLIIFDAGDRERNNKSNGWGHLRDSLVLLDHFEWKYDSTTITTTEVIN